MTWYSLSRLLVIWCCFLSCALQILSWRFFHILCFRIQCRNILSWISRTSLSVSESSKTHHFNVLTDLLECILFLLLVDFFLLLLKSFSNANLLKCILDFVKKTRNNLFYINNSLWVFWSTQIGKPVNSDSILGGYFETTDIIMFFILEILDQNIDSLNIFVNRQNFTFFFIFKYKWISNQEVHLSDSSHVKRILDTESKLNSFSKFCDSISILLVQHVQIPQSLMI